jgi:hypothetical protein
MPMSASSTSEALVHARPFIGPASHIAMVKVDISDLTTYEVDENGYIKPGLPLDKSGNTIGDGVAVFGCVAEATKIVDANPTNTSLGNNTGTAFVPVATICQVNRDIVEDVLGRALTAYEIAGFDLAGSKCVLSRT